MDFSSFSFAEFTAEAVDGNLLPLRVDIDFRILLAPPFASTEVAFPGAQDAFVIGVVSVFNTVVALPALGAGRRRIVGAGSHQAITERVLI